MAKPIQYFKVNNNNNNNLKIYKILKKNALNKYLLNMFMLSIILGAGDSKTYEVVPDL